MLQQLEGLTKKFLSKGRELRGTLKAFQKWIQSIKYGKIRLKDARFWAYALQKPRQMNVGNCDSL